MTQTWDVMDTCFRKNNPKIPQTKSDPKNGINDPKKNSNGINNPWVIYVHRSLPLPLYPLEGPPGWSQVSDISEEISGAGGEKIQGCGGSPRWLADVWWWLITSFWMNISLENSDGANATQKFRAKRQVAHQRSRCELESGQVRPGLDFGFGICACFPLQIILLCQIFRMSSQ